MSTSRCGSCGGRRLHAGRGVDAGARHRRQQRHLRAGRRHPAAAAAASAIPDRLVTIWETQRDHAAQSCVSPLNMIDWNARSRTFEKIAGYTPSVGGMVMAGADGNAETVSRQWVTAGIFDVLGVRPIAGRTFTAADEQQRAQRRGAERGVLARRGSTPTRRVVGREHPARRHRCTPWSASCRRTFSCSAHSSLWAMRPFVDAAAAARAARTCCR